MTTPFNALKPFKKDLFFYDPLLAAIFSHASQVRPIARLTTGYHTFS
jgi:hypothetical protein